MSGVPLKPPTTGLVPTPVAVTTFRDGLTVTVVVSPISWTDLGALVCIPLAGFVNVAVPPPPPPALGKLKRSSRSSGPIGFVSKELASPPFPVNSSFFDTTDASSLAFGT